MDQPAGTEPSVNAASEACTISSTSGRVTLKPVSKAMMLLRASERRLDEGLRRRSGHRTTRERSGSVPGPGGPGRLPSARLEAAGEPERLEGALVRTPAFRHRPRRAREGVD